MIPVVFGIHLNQGPQGWQSDGDWSVIETHASMHDALKSRDTNSHELCATRSAQGCTGQRQTEKLPEPGLHSLPAPSILLFAQMKHNTPRLAQELETCLANNEHQVIMDSFVAQRNLEDLDAEISIRNQPLGTKPPNL